MIGLLRTALGALKGGIDWLLGRQRAEERAGAEETGAQKQRLADMEERADARDDQLDKAIQRRPGDARRRLRDGDF